MTSGYSHNINRRPVIQEELALEQISCGSLENPAGCVVNSTVGIDDVQGDSERGWARGWVSARSPGILDLVLGSEGAVAAVINVASVLPSELPLALIIFFGATRMATCIRSSPPPPSDPSTHHSNRTAHDNIKLRPIHLLSITSRYIQSLQDIRSHKAHVRKAASADLAQHSGYDRYKHHHILHHPTHPHRHQPPPCPIPRTPSPPRQAPTHTASIRQRGEYPADADPCTHAPGPSKPRALPPKLQPLHFNRTMAEKSGTGRD